MLDGVAAVLKVEGFGGCRQGYPVFLGIGLSPFKGA